MGKVMAEIRARRRERWDAIHCFVLDVPGRIPPSAGKVHDCRQPLHVFLRAFKIPLRCEEVPHFCE